MLSLRNDRFLLKYSGYDLGIDLLYWKQRMVRSHIYRYKRETGLRRQRERERKREIRRRETEGQREKEKKERKRALHTYKKKNT